MRQPTRAREICEHGEKDHAGEALRSMRKTNEVTPQRAPHVPAVRRKLQRIEGRQGDATHGKLKGSRAPR